MPGIFSEVKSAFIYGWNLFKDATRMLEQGRGAKTKALASILGLTGVLAIAGIKFDFDLKDWLTYPPCSVLFLTMLLMIFAAFKRHKQQEAEITKLKQAAEPKLVIKRVFRSEDPIRVYSCRVTIFNSSTSIASNVNIQFAVDASLRGFFNALDLVPTNSKDSINPQTESEWEFPAEFNKIASIFTNSQVLKTGSELKVENM